MSVIRIECHNIVFPIKKYVDMRLFLALPVEAETALKIVEWRDKSFPPERNWVPIANYHVTLAFIGGLQAAHYEALCEQCDQVIANVVSPCHEVISIDQTGYWPKPQILWIGPKEWPKAITKLHTELLQMLALFGVRKDKKVFQPHITLARKSVLPVKPMIEPYFEIAAQQVVLYESIQTRAGVCYQERESWSVGR